MEQRTTFDEMVLRWVESLHGLPREARLRVLQHTCDSLALRPDAKPLAAKAQSVMRAVQTAPDTGEMRRVAVSLVKNCVAASIEKQLVPYCTLTLRCGHRTVRRLADAANVAAELAAQNTAATGRWRLVGEPQTWALATDGMRTIGVRTGFALDSEEVTVSFHDEVAFDACGRVDHIERTLLVSCPSNEDDVRAALCFGSTCLPVSG
ncbi:hypothetical protein DQ04_00311170 [Trypanosoma grayi]|uniref:hypothetical protein n=1 Tax=Trypanosoma grayi TaxID=71804 RepID=UPI0004F414BE|nr:hypothetical protein DQ04_00311170 [Trypanosoma grayi]KEG14781.1 hypothetical protein DQ04_00311170 [Trypanosoma grayi]